MTADADLAPVLDAMQRLQFTATESRLYVALLREQPATGYELAAVSGVPRSAIYGTLKKMTAAGLVRQVEDNPAKYAPLPPEQLCERLERQYTASVSELRDAFARMPQKARLVELWQVAGRDEVLAEAAERVAQAERSVHASLWGREAAALVAAFDGAVHRGLDVVLFAHTPLPVTQARAYSAGIAEGELERHWPHRLVLVVDRHLLLVAEMGDEPYAVVTEEPALVAMAANNLILDLTLHGQRFGVDTTDAIAGLQDHLAPIDELLARA